MKRVRVVVLSLSSVCYCTCFGQSRARSDFDLLNEALVAMEKYNDCRAVSEALDEVSETGCARPLWIFCAMESEECSGSLDEALELTGSIMTFRPEEGDY